MQDDATDWVLVLADAIERARWLDLLDQHGYHTLAATHTAHALALLRRSPQALVVVFDVPHIYLLNAVIPDRRSARHHAYILVSAPGDVSVAPMETLFEQLSLQRLAYPYSAQALLEAVARASQRFPTPRPYAAPIAGGAQLGEPVTQP